MILKSILWHTGSQCSDINNILNQSWDKYTESILCRLQWGCILCVWTTLAAQNYLLDADILTYWDIIKHNTWSFCWSLVVPPLVQRGNHSHFMFSKCNLKRFSLDQMKDRTSDTCHSYRHAACVTQIYLTQSPPNSFRWSFQEHPVAFIRKLTPWWRSELHFLTKTLRGGWELNQKFCKLCLFFC